MPSALRKNWVVLIRFGLLTAMMAWTQSASADQFSGLSTRDFQLLPADQCSFASRGLGTDIPRSALSSLVSWAPTGLGTQPAYPGCDAAAIRGEITGARTGSAQGVAIQGLINRCSAIWSRSEPSDLEPLISLLQVRYDLCQNSRMRRIVLRPDRRTILRGVLALKPGSQPRPLIIVRCGLLCNAGDLSHRFLLMHLFDASPFNVLAVANVTGTDYVNDNQYVALGGVFEGTQLMNIAKLVSSTPLAGRVSSYHLASVSLGAHGVLYASQMNQFAHAQGYPRIASSLALCPVVDLRPTAQDLFDEGWRGTIAKRLFFDDVLGVIRMFPGLGMFFLQTRAADIPNNVGNAAASYLASLPAGWALPPFDSVRIQTSDDLWAANRFLTYAGRNPATPTLAFAALDDLVVSTTLNAWPLTGAVRFGGNLGVSIAPKGNHCAFNIAYGWETATEIYRSFFLSHSPELNAIRRTRTATIDANWLRGLLALGPGEAYSRFEIAATARSTDLTLTASIWSLERGCRSPWDASGPCVRTQRLRLPFWAFQGAQWATEAPRTDSEAEALTRYANANIQIADDTGRTTLGTSQSASKVMWTSFAD